MAELTAFFIQLVKLIFPGDCYDEIFIKQNYFDVDCLRLALSKVFSYGIIIGSVLVKLPQIIKIILSKSGRGINLYSVTMELGAITASVAYGFAQKYSFSSYGESVFLVVQTSIIGFLVLFYQKQQVKAVVYLAVYGGILALLLSPVVPLKIILLLQMSTIPVITVSKLIQAYDNYKARSTGQLSAVTIFLLFAGALARIFTSMEETGDQLLMLTYVVSAALNGLIAFQVLYYWNSSTSSTKKSRNKKSKKS